MVQKIEATFRGNSKAKVYRSCNDTENNRSRNKYSYLEKKIKKITLAS